MNEFDLIKSHLIDNLTKVPYNNGDISDIGNEIGIVLGHYIKSEDDLNSFISGLMHGISLTNGEH